MKTLADTLLAPHHRDEFLTDTVRLIETHVAGLSGLKGMSFRAALAGASRAIPDMIPRGTRRYMPQFLATLEPLYAQFRAEGPADFSVFLTRNSEEAAEALLSVTDERMALSTNSTAQSFYRTFRGFVARELTAAMPAFGKLIRNYLD